MLKKIKQYFKSKKEAGSHDYELTYDNVAIPEIHTHKTTIKEDTGDESQSISYDNVAIPEVHIRKREK